MYLSDAQRIQTVERYLKRQKRFIESHVKSLGCRYHTVDFNVYGFIVRANVLDDRFCVELHSNEWCGLFHCLEKYPCKCTKEKLLQGIFFWLEKTYLGLDTKFWDTITKEKLTDKYDEGTLEIAKRHETLTYRAEEVTSVGG